MREIRIVERLCDIAPAQWHACFAHEAENYEYLLAVEQAGLQGFHFAYVTAWEGDMLVAAMPAFFTDYALDTTLQGTGKKITTAIAMAFPNLLKVKLASLGSPCTECLSVGFHPDIAADAQALLIAQMLEAFEQDATQRGCRLLGLKDIPDPMLALWQPSLQARNYASLPGMPTATLAIDFADMDAYMAQLSAGTRKDMRRKLNAAAAIEIQTVHTLDSATLQQLMVLYHETKSRSDWQFEELSADYFQGVLARMPGSAFCQLYYAQGQLLAANLLVRSETTLIDKFFCMNHVQGRDYNLYFLSWFTNLRYCFAQGLRHYQSGQEGYENKRRLGSHLIRNHLYFKHKNVFAQGLLGLVSPLLAADETLKEAA